MKILFATQHGTSKRIAHETATLVQTNGLKFEVISLDQYAPDDLLEEVRVAFVVATGDGGKPPARCAKFFEGLDEMNADFRVQKDALKKLRFTILGLGNKGYALAGNFNKVAVRLKKQLRQLGAREFCPTVLADELGDFDAACQQWQEALCRAMAEEDVPEASPDPEPVPPLEGGESDAEDTVDATPSKLVDLEDLGEVYGKRPPNSEMLNPRLRKSLTKQGYKLIGTHSAVKLCRWTKAMLRGRGGCYKHTFYGIQSSQCMEMTPALACANKCVFCWRHHSNPVTREWRWKTDDPEEVVNGAVEAHTQMIRTLKGVPGVLPDRFAQALQPRHCALSLVGEPILYPEVNALARHMHERGISTFMVTNAQFPDRIEQLCPVTQLYVSIDAATPETLKAVDRPIFDDYWTRFLGCLDAIARREERTVFRLTLVKGWNMAEVEAYAALVLRGRPDFIEVKGVTYSGDGNNSSLTIKNCPYHEEVLQFCHELSAKCNEAMGPSYEVACEHAHSVCVLIAHRKFKVDGQWHTWIDYPRFFELAAAGGAVRAEDYGEPTPAWAVVGAAERGFTPTDTRHMRRTKA